MKGNKINHLFSWIRNTVLKVVTDIFDLVEEKGPEAVKLAQLIKNKIEKHDREINWITDLTESTKDDKAHAFIKGKLPMVVHELAVIEGLVDKDTSHEVAAKYYAQYIMSKQKEGRAKEWVDLAARILIAIIGKKIPLDIAIMATQRFYRILFAKN